jgi:hypothetical protein
MWLRHGVHSNDVAGKTSVGDVGISRPTIRKSQSANVSKIVNVVD